MNTEAMGAPVTAVGTFREVTGQDSPTTVMRTGYLRAHQGKVYCLFKAAGAIGDGVGFKKDATTGSEITVIASAAAADVLEGVNNTGVALASGNYFWGLVSGVGYGAPDGTGWNDGDPICGSATAATFGVATVGTHHVIGKAVNDDSATVNANIILWKFQ